MLQRFKLFGAIVPSRRCLRCNGLLEPVSKGEVLHRLEPKTRQYYHEFAICAPATASTGRAPTTSTCSAAWRGCADGWACLVTVR